MVRGFGESKNNLLNPRHPRTIPGAGPKLYLGGKKHELLGNN
jgi:hypothetical protein